MTNAAKTTESQEMYLVYVKRIMDEKQKVRLIDIVNVTGFSKSTVHDGIERLVNKKLIVKENGCIILTREGLEIVEKIEAKHKAIYELLKTIGASHEMAEEHACLIEHMISDDLKLVIDNFCKCKCN